MPWTPAITLTELKQNVRQTAVIEGKKILFIWHDDKVHAVQSQCPHFKLPLKNSEITEQNEIICPFHKSAFDLTTGKVLCWAPWPAAVSKLLGNLSKSKPLKIYPTQVKGDQILVDASCGPQECGK